MQANVLTFISHQTTIGVTFPCSYTAISVMDVQGGFYGPSYSRGSISCWFTKRALGTLLGLHQEKQALSLTHAKLLYDQVTTEFVESMS